MGTPTWRELMAMDDSELERRFDVAARHAEGGTAFWGDILSFRATMRSTDQMVQLTAAITVQLTAAITALTRRIYALTAVAVALGVVSVVVAIIGRS